MEDMQLEGVVYAYRRMLIIQIDLPVQTAGALEDVLHNVDEGRKKDGVPGSRSMWKIRS